MLVVLPFHAGDVSQLANLLIWMGQLRGGLAWREGSPGRHYPNHHAVLIADVGVDWAGARKVHDLASAVFPRAELTSTDISVAGWPQGPNALFASACRKCTDTHWLWLEPDAVPLHRDWLDLIATEYEGCDERFFGCLYPSAQPNLPNVLLSGIAVYPAGWIEGSLCSTRAGNVAFDVAMTDLVRGSWRHTQRIQHVWGEPDLAPTFPPAGAPMPRNGFTLAKLQGNAVIFHRNKDGTLIARLRERAGLEKPVSYAQPTRGLLRVRRTGSLGDVCAATVVAKKLTRLGYEVEFQAHASTHCVLRRIPGIHHLCEPHGAVDVDLDGAYENHRSRRGLHFARMFVDRANESLRTHVIGDARNFAPRMVMEPNDAPAAREVMGQYPRPWVVIVPRSHSWANRTVPDDVWAKAAAQIKGTKFWLALHPAPSPGGEGERIIDLNCRHFDRAIGFLGVADLVVTVDTGPMHVAAALGTPVVAIQQASSPELHLSDQRDFIMVSPHLTCLNCQLDLCPLDAARPPCQAIPPEKIALAANARLQSVFGDGVAVVMCVYKPNVQKLNRALDAVLPQVDEIVVVRDQGGVLPAGALNHPKIRYLQMPVRDVGYGRKANYGFRHTNQPYVLLLNDDLYLHADAVPKLRAVMGVGVGMVAHLLRYPDGTIQHGGTYRAPGSPGWGHLDHRARQSRIQSPVEMENVCGASVLVRRKAFYDAGGFDEDFYLYCEDNALCLAIRQAGWQIWYTPHAEGIHEESQSTSVTQNIRAIMDQSHETLKRKWSWYFHLNRHNSMGVFE